MKPVRINRPHQTGALLIEVLVAMLLLSFGILSLGAMLSFSVQMPKLSGYRALAINLASGHIDRIRANPGGFNDYKKPLSQTDWSFEDIEDKSCHYPDCNAASLATMDDAATRRAVRVALPAGDLLLTCDTPTCNKDSHGNLWIVWQEPSANAALNPSFSDNCSAEVTKVYIDPKPRCVNLGFKL